MKNIEALVTDLETSKQLQEAGIEYETAFVWVLYDSGAVLELNKEDIKTDFKDKIIPAFTVGEMMQVLPCRIKKNEISYYLVLSKDGDGYTASYENPFDIDDILYKFVKLIAHQALAKLCLWCKKEGYL